jgi:CheY-like chemotaxis protein
MAESGSQTPAGGSGKPGAERRRWPRIQITQPVRLRSADPAVALQEVSSTVDVSREGIYFLTRLNSYRVGMQLRVVFPYIAERPPSPDEEHPAEVVRVKSLPNGLCGVALRFEARPAKRGASSAKQAAASGTGPAVLAVDSDSRSLGVLWTTLAGAGYEVKALASAEKALHQLRRMAPDILIVAIGSGDPGALDLCHVVKRDAVLREVPLVLINARGDVDEYRAAKDLGAMVCIPKPLKPEQLLQVVSLLAPVPADAKATRKPVPADVKAVRK